jgi:cation:H+ antiporter
VPGPGWLLWAGALALGLAILVKASDWFTDAAVRLGHAFGMPSFLIGVTIIALGTSLPELVSSLVAVFHDAPEIVAGNVIGSNIANLLLVLGLAGVVAGQLRLAYNLLGVDLPFVLGSALFLGAIAWNGLITRGEAFMALVGYVIYFSYALAREKPDEEASADETGAEHEQATAAVLKPILLLAGTAALIYVGAQLTIQAVIALAALVGLGTGLDLNFDALANTRPDDRAGTGRKTGGLRAHDLSGSGCFECLRRADLC